MSSTDKRIVEMQFDNEQFERGIQTSTKSLENLNKTLQMDGASKGMSALERAVETVTHRFSALGIMGDQVLRNITNSAYYAGKRLISSLSTDQITAGMSKYEQKTASVQTIMNATGKSIEEVNGYLEKLMWFSDETSYGFTDMTSALATMVSSGGDIDKLIPMITGVANATAFAGKGAAEFGRIMQFGINQAYSLGHMQVQDWKSIEGATVNSKQLMESLISAGEAAGAIKKGEITTKNFRQSLADKWLNTTVMEEGFGRFSALSEAAYEAVKNKEYDTASEAIEALAGNFDEISVKAFKAAQTAKSFSEAIAATKDAVSSGWMRTFEIIFGNFEEATALWTEVTGVLWGVFAAGSIARNELLKNWKDIGGRDNFLQGIRNTWNSLYSITLAIGDAFKTIFPPMTAERLASMSKSFEAFTESVLNWLLDPVAGVTRFEKITKIFKGFFSIFDIGKTVIKGIAEAIGSVLKPILPGAIDGLLDFFVVIADAISNFAANLKTNETFQNITKAIGDTVSGLVGVLGSAWNDITIFISKIWKYWFKPTLRKTQTSAGTTLIESGTRFKDFIDTLQPYIQKVKDFVAAIPSIVSAIWEFGKRIYTYLSTSEDVKKWVESFKAFIEPFISKIKAWRTRLKNALRGLFGEKGLDKTKSFWALLKEQFATTEGAKQFIDNVVNLVKTAWETIKKKIAEIFTGKKDPSKDWLRLASGGSTDFSYSDGKKASEKDGPFAGIFAFFEGIWTWIKGNWGWFAGGAIAIVLVKVFNLVNTWSKLGKIIARGKYPSQLGNNVLKIAGAISAMIGGIYLLTTLDQDKMKEARKTVIIIGALLAGLSLIGSIPGLKGARLGAGMLGMSAGILLIIMSIEKIMALFKSIGGAENWSELIPALTLVVGILALLAIMSKGLSGMEIKGKHGWKSIIALAGSVWLIVQALLPIATMEWEDLGKMGVALLGLTVAIGLLIGVSKHIGKYGAQKSKIAGMIGLAAGIWLIIKALKPVASMEWEDLGKMGAVLGGIVGILSLFILSSKGMNAAGAVSAIGSLVAMAAVIGVLGIALREVRDVSWEKIAAFTGGLALLLGVNGFFALKPALNVLGGLNILISNIGLAAAIASLGFALSLIPDSVDEWKILAFTGGLALLLGVNNLSTGLISLIPGLNLIGALGVAITNASLAVLVALLGVALSLIPDNVDEGKISAFTGGLALLLGVNNLSTGLISLIPGLNLIGALGVAISNASLAVVIWTLGDAIGQIPDSVDEGKISAFTGGLALLLGVNNLSTGLISLIPGLNLIGALGVAISNASLAVVIWTLGDAIGQIPDNVDEKKITAFTDGLIKLIGINNLSTGLISLIPGLNLLGAWSTAITNSSLADIIKTLGNTLSEVQKANVTPETMSSFTTAVESVIGLNDSLEEMGLGELFTANFFGTEMIVLAGDVIAFSTGLTSLIGAVSGIKSPIQFYIGTLTAIGAVKAISSLFDTLKEEGSLLLESYNWWGKFWGNKTATESVSSNLETFSGAINEMATSFSGFEVGGLEQKATEAAKAASVIAEFLNRLHGDGDLAILSTPYDYYFGDSIFFQELGKLGGYISTFDTTVKDVDVSRFNTLIYSISKFSESLNTFSTTITPESVDTLKQALVEMSGVLSVDFVENIATGIQNGTTDITTAIDGLLTAGTEEIKTAVWYKNFSDSALNITNGIYAGIQTRGASIKLAIGSVLSAGITEITSSTWYTAFQEAAKNIVSGVASGVAKYAYLANDAMRILGESMEAALNESLKVESPSKLTFQTGVFLVDGLVNALESEKERAIKAAVALGDAVSNALVKSDKVRDRIVGNYEVNERGWYAILDQEDRDEFGWKDDDEALAAEMAAALHAYEEYHAAAFLNHYNQATHVGPQTLTPGITLGDNPAEVWTDEESAAFWGLTEGFVRSGKNIVKGLSDSITKNTPLATEAVTTMGGRIKNALDLSLEIKSPSRVAFQTGTYLVDGLVNAIDTEGDRAVDTAVALGESVSEALDESLNFVGMSSGGGGNSPSVTVMSDGGTGAKPKTFLDVIADGAKEIVDSVSESTQTIRERVESGDSWWTKIVDALTGNTDDKKDDKKDDRKTGSTNPPSTNTNPTINPPSPARVDRVGTVGVGLNQANELAALLNKLDILNSNVSGMQIVMDSGALVGQISTKLDRQLGINSKYAGRG